VPSKATEIGSARVAVVLDREGMEYPMKSLDMMRPESF